MSIGKAIGLITLLVLAVSAGFAALHIPLIFMLPVGGVIGAVVGRRIKDDDQVAERVKGKG